MVVAAVAVLAQQRVRKQEQPLAQVVLANNLPLSWPMVTLVILEAAVAEAVERILALRLLLVE